jgi:hypothetical protein
MLFRGLADSQLKDLLRLAAGIEAVPPPVAEKQRVQLREGLVAE